MFQLLAVLAQEEEAHKPITHDPILPEGYEIWFGGVCALVILGVLIWKITPTVKKFFADRTARIQKDLDDAANAKASAAAESAQIRQAKGDIEGERARLLAEADAQAAQLLADGRERLAAELAELETKANADIAGLAARSGEELRAEIGRHAAAATDRLAAEVLDGPTQQRLVEEYIAKVGASR